MTVTVLGKIREAIVPFSVERLQGKVFLSTSGMRITLSTCGNTLDAAQSSAERALTCFLGQHVREKVSVRRVPSASEVAGWDPEQILFLCTMHTPGAYAEFHDLFA